MSIGKYISLEEAMKHGKLDRFCKEHPSKGDKKAFEDLLNNMALNRPVKKTVKVGKTLFKGLRWHKKDKCWHARIKINYKQIYLGMFKNEEDAARAYDEGAKKYFGEYARLNFANGR